MKAQATILGLMGFIAFIAVGMAALRTNDEVWAAVFLALTFFTLCTAALVAIYRRGAWAGFAVFGWAQFFICQPHSAPALGPTTLPMAMAYRIFFHVGDPAHFSLRAGLCLDKHLVGFVGAIVGGFIARHGVASRDFVNDDRPRLTTPP